MRTLYYFHSGSDPEVHGFTDEPTGTKLPAEQGPWTLQQQIEPDHAWTHHANKAAVMAGVVENGFALHYEDGPATPKVGS